ncbi:hypothetical protein BASA82_000680 [Batrachochytrium salamandrivorans]|nr:hypothetical protein BASA82_000680 [Batrachochytrium salamandrivorans]
MEALANTTGGLFKRVAKLYQSAVYKELNKYGLRYEDLLITEHPDVQFALKYIPKEELTARNRRITRAIMLSTRHEYLPTEVQQLQTPGKWYMKDLMEEGRKLREERDKLNNF